METCSSQRSYHHTTPIDEENAGGSAAPKDQATQGDTVVEMEPVSNGESAVDPDAPKSYEQRLFEFCYQRNLQNLPPSAPLPFLHFKELREMNTVHLHTMRAGQV